MFKIGINRADITHVLMALWMPVVVFLYLRGKYAVKLSKFAYATIIFSILWLVLRSSNGWIAILIIAPAIYATGAKYPKFVGNLALSRFTLAVFAITLLCAYPLKISLNYSKDGYLWVSQILSPPHNRSLVSEDIRWVSAKLAAADAHCVFDLSNNGLINGVAGLPACTIYTYPAYATQRYEADMLQQLQQSNPPTVVFSSSGKFFIIDGKSMHDRFPELKKYLVKAYPYEECNLGYCLRYASRHG
jgi:hypothetical protein